MHINFLVDDVGASQLGFFLIQRLNEMVENIDNVDPMVFYANMTEHCVRPVKFSMMQLIEVWNQPGPTFATSMSMAARLLKMPRPHPKFFYVWDLEWMRIQPKIYDSIQSIFCNPHLKIIARCKDHAIAIENGFNRSVDGIIEDFNIEQLLEVIDNVR